LLASGRAEDALAQFESLPVTAVTSSGALVARGLVHEKQGDLAAAALAFDAAAELGVPVAELVREIARWYGRAAEHRRSYAFYSLLEQLAPGSMVELFAQPLPPAALAALGGWALAREVREERPRHWFYPPYKEALCARHGPEVAGLVFCALAGFEFGAVRRLPLNGLREYAVRHSPAFEELSPRRPIELPAPPVYRRPRQEPMRSMSRSVFFCTVQDAVVSSKGNLILTENAALLDAQPDELAKVAVDLSCEPELFAEQWPLAREGEPLDLLLTAGGLEPAMDRAFHLVGVNSYNFGHWHMEFLPKLWACRDRPGFSDVPILVDEQMPPQNLEALRVLLGDHHPVHVLPRGTSVRVRELWVCSTPVYVPLAAAWGAEPAPDLMACDGVPFAEHLIALRPRLEALAEPASRPRRLFLTRKDGQHRRLVNRAEVEQWFVAQGFEVYDFAEHSFRQQLELVRSAEAIVGPDGSSFMTTFYARAGTRIGILDNPYLEDNEWYVNVSEALGQRLLYFVGDVVEPDASYRFRAGYRVDVGALPGFLDELMAP
jgi:hypothetical protein